MTTNMEGVLWKWTNYLSGWQPRWFILDNGVLSYYKSQEDVNNGCKGSIKMTVCDIVVHPADMTRLDLIIPGEQHYYVKASTPQDRQSWLIALGSAKASFNDTSVAKKDADALPDQVRVKKSELRLYCDLLMQQAHSVKETVSAGDRQVDTDKLMESTSLIGATCDTFIATLEECMKLVSNTPMFESSHQHVRDSAIPSSPTRSNAHRLPGTRATITTRQPSERIARLRPNIAGSTDTVKIHRSSPAASTNHSSLGHDHVGSLPSTVSSSPTTIPSTPTALSSVSMTPLSATLSTPSSAQPPPAETVNGTKAQVVGTTTTVATTTTTLDEVIKPPAVAYSTASTSSSIVQITPALSAATSSEDLVEDFKDAIDARISTFFSAMTTDFSHVDIGQPDGVLVLPFLDACRNIVPIFDKLNGTAFAPVKMDFSGNIKKIHQKQSSNPEKFTTLQSMIADEIQNNQHTHANSATSALLWLKRSLEFIREFLREVCSGSLELSTCASNAYNRTLKNYHGWVVRGVFAVAVKALPYREVFITHLHSSDSADPDSISPVAVRQFEHALLADIEGYIIHLDRVLTVISDYYIQHSLDSDERV